MVLGTVKVALVLLVRNELPCLRIMLPTVPAPGPAAGYDLIVAVDGGSLDGSVEFLGQHGIAVVAQSERGRGEAFKHAFAKVDADAYIFFSPDGNEAVNDLPRFRPLLEQGADIVIASRMQAGARNEEDDQLLRWRKWTNKTLNFAANVLFRRAGPYVTDSINGYRAITRAAAARLNLSASDYTIEFQMTIRAMKARMRIVEYPTIEGNRVAGVTGAPSLPTGLRFLRRLWREVRGGRD